MTKRMVYSQYAIDVANLSNIEVGRFCQLSGIRPKLGAFAKFGHPLLCNRDFLPNLKRLSMQQTIIDRL
jgi:hypothetical protein